MNREFKNTCAKIVYYDLKLIVTVLIIIFICLILKPNCNMLASNTEYRK